MIWGQIILNYIKTCVGYQMYIANTNPTLASPTRTIFHWLALGLVLGITGFPLGLPDILLGLPGFLDTNMLVSAMRNTRVGAVLRRFKLRIILVRINQGNQSYSCISYIFISTLCKGIS